MAPTLQSHLHSHSPQSPFSTSVLPPNLSPLQSVTGVQSDHHSSPVLSNIAFHATSPIDRLNTSWPFLDQREARLMHHYIVELSSQVGHEVAATSVRRLIFSCSSTRATDNSILERNCRNERHIAPLLRTPSLPFQHGNCPFLQAKRITTQINTPASAFASSLRPWKIRWGIWMKTCLPQ